MPKKYKNEIFCRKLGGGKLVRFLEFDNFGSKLGGKLAGGRSWFVYVGNLEKFVDLDGCG